ncbi:MAG TPA: hypothetical protein PLP17_06520 [Oligoflexia bacterium]|nr:hypothetical protein [Oligoflexia bacterium]
MPAAAYSICGVPIFRSFSRRNHQCKSPLALELETGVPVFQSQRLCNVFLTDGSGGTLSASIMLFSHAALRLADTVYKKGASRDHGKKGPCPHFRC